MTQSERLVYLINYLKNESKFYKNIDMPYSTQDKKILLRSLMNVREAGDISDEFVKIQDEYLQEVLRNKSVTDERDIPIIRDKMCIWQGDITTLKCDAVVNACNSYLLGCFVPMHKCIDNAIHTYAGVQLRNKCKEIMDIQGHPEPTGVAKITSGYNLPSKYVIHTVGPIVGDKLSENDCKLLANCYKSCLELAETKGIKSIAFCCISTGEFHFPNDKACEIAIETVSNYLKNSSIEKVIFNVFKDNDKEIYKRYLCSNR